MAVATPWLANIDSGIFHASFLLMLEPLETLGTTAVPPPVSETTVGPDWQPISAIKVRRRLR